MQGRGELLAAVFFRDDHPEEAFVLDELPSVRRQVLIDLRRLPVVHHRAQLLGLVVQERLFFGGEPWPRYQARRGRETSRRRRGARPSTTPQKANIPASTRKASVGSAPPTRPARSATAPAAIQIHPDEFR